MCQLCARAFGNSISPWCRIEAPEWRGRLILPSRHKVAVDTYEIAFIADLGIAVVLAGVLDPNRLVYPLIAPRHRPGPCQCTVYGGDLVVEQMARTCLVEVDPLLDDCIIVAVHGQAAAVERAWSPHPARLDQKRVVTTVPVLVDPLADRIAVERRGQFLRP